MKNPISPLIYFVVFLMWSSSFQNEEFAQSCYNVYVDSIVSKVSLHSVSIFNRELSGDTSTIIGGLPYTIIFISEYFETLLTSFSVNCI